MHVLSCLVLVLCWPGPGAPGGPGEQTPAPLGELLREGFDLYQRDQYEKARARFEEALGRAASAADAAAEAEARRGLGRCLFRQGQYEPARDQLERARAIFGSLSDRLGEARAASHLGSVVLLMGEQKQAAELYAHALSEFQALGARHDEVETRYNLLYVTDDLEEQGRLVQEGLAGAAALGDVKLEGKFLQTAAELEFDQGRFASAAEKLERASRLFEEAGTRFDQARALNSLARLQRTHGQTETAREVSARALRIQEEIGDSQGMIQSLDHLADAESVLGHHRLALELYERALRLAAQTGSARVVGAMRGRAAEAYLRGGQPARAAELLEGVVREGFDPDAGVMLYRQLARSYLGLERGPEALAAAEKAVVLARQSGKIDRLLPALFVRALARQGLGYREEALADAREGAAALERLRAELVPADFMKRGFGDEHQAAFGLTIELLADQGLDREALEVAEQARARAFLDLLATREAGAPGTPARVAPAGAPGLETLAASAVTAPAASAQEVAATARRLGSTLLSYFVAREALFIWVVPPEGSVRVTRVAVSSERLWDLVRQTRTALREAGARRAHGESTMTTRGGGVLLIGAGGTRAWRQLHDLLIGPVRSQLPRVRGSRLTVVPHGPLFLLSFAALQDARGRYLLEDYSLHYSPSAAVLRATVRKARTLESAPPRRVFVADPRFLPEEGVRLPQLPGTRREVRASAGLLPPGDTVVLAGRDAPKANVRRLAPGAGLLHFATHGIVRDDQPLDSFLALSRGERPEGTDDGRLTVRDIYGLDLQATLVVLSACRTGLGHLSSDGMVGLTRAFFYAGAPSVVATLWDVADEPTFRLVSSFYSHLAHSPDKALALRSAQLSMLRALRAGQVQIAAPAGAVTLPEHPVLWAGFILVGEP